MGACQTGGSLQLCPVVALQMFLQMTRQFCYGSKGIRDGGNGLVSQTKFLRKAGKLPMVLGCCFSQGIIKSGPVRDQQGAHLAQPQIVLRQNLQYGRIFKVILQNPAFLIQNSIIFCKGSIIIGPQLAQGMVSQPPPLRGAGFEHHQILRAEQNRRQNTGNFSGGLLFYPILPDLTGTAAGKQHPAQVLLPLLGMHRPFQIRKVRPKADHFSGFQGAKTLSGTQIGNGFQQIGLSLGVITYDQVHTRSKFQSGILIIAEIPQMNAIKPHCRRSDRSGP